MCTDTEVATIVEYLVQPTVKVSHHIDGNASKPHISKMHNVQETPKTVSKKLETVFATSIFAILVDFAIKFWYKPLTLYRERCQKYISVKILFSSKIIM